MLKQSISETDLVQCEQEQVLRCATETVHFQKRIRGGLLWSKSSSESRIPGVNKIPIRYTLGKAPFTVRYSVNIALGALTLSYPGF